MDRRLSPSDIAAMRRSLAMSPHLPAEQVAWLLDEAERLVGDRARLADLTRRLSGPWKDVRAALNELHQLAADDGTRGPAPGADGRGGAYSRPHGGR